MKKFLCIFIVLHIKTTYNTEILFDNSNNTSAMDLSFVSHQELIDSSYNGANEFIPFIDFDNDYNITDAKTIVINAAIQTKLVSNSEDEEMTENKDSLMYQTENYEKHVLKKKAVPDVKLNIDNTNKNFLLCTKKIDQKSHQKTFYNNNPKHYNKKPKISTKYKNTKRYRNKINTKALIKGENKNKHNNTITNNKNSIMFAKPNRNMLHILMYDTEKEDEKILLELFYPCPCNSKITLRKQIIDWQNIDLDHSYGFSSYKNTIKLLFLGHETIDNEVLHQFANGKQTCVVKIKSLTWYADVDDDLRVKNCNIYLIYKIRLIDRMGFQFDCVKACFNHKDRVVIYYYKCFNTINCHRIVEEQIDYIINKHIEICDTNNAKDLTKRFAMICNEKKEKMNLQINDTNSVRKHASMQSFSLCIKINKTYIEYISGLNTQQFKIKKSALNYSYEHIYCLLKKLDIKNIPKKILNYDKCYDINCFFCDSAIIGLCENCFKVHLVALVLEFDSNKQKIVIQKQYEYYIFIMEKFLQYFWYIIENGESVKGDLHNKFCFFHWYEDHRLSYKQITLYVLRLYLYVKIKNKFEIINNLLNINDFEKLMQLKKDLSHDTLNDNANTILKANFKGLEYHLCQLIGFFYLPAWLTEKYREIIDLKTSNLDGRFSSDIKILDGNFLFLIKDLTLNTQNEIEINDDFNFCWNQSSTNITTISSFFGLLGCYDKELRVYNEADSYLKFCEGYLIDGKLFTELANKYVKNLYNPSNRNQYVASLVHDLLDDPNLFSEIFAKYIQEIFI